MEFKVSSQELLKGISDVSKAIPSKSALAILENFLFVLNGNILEITASDPPRRAAWQYPPVISSTC